MLISDWSSDVCSSDLAGQILTAEVQPELPILRGDQRVLVQVLNNLLSNAIKFTPQGGRIAVRAWADAAGSILLSVADNGIGITEEGLAKELRPFAQAHNARAREPQGTGLALPLRHIFHSERRHVEKECFSQCIYRWS